MPTRTLRGLAWVIAAVGCGGQVVAPVTAERAQARGRPAVDAAVAEPADLPDVPPPVVAAAPPEATRPGPPALPEGETVRVAELVEALEAIAVELEASPTLQQEHAAFVRDHGGAPEAITLRDYVRVRLVFESVRDGGLWQLRWAVTNEQPRSDAIWAQWAALDDWDPATGGVTATAECDELSALFAHLVRRLGVDGVGLFWPTWNHVVAVWTVGEAPGVRIVVPTSQIFLDAEATLGTDGFDPWQQKRIYEYRRRDVRDDFALPGGLVRFFVTQSWAGGALTTEALQRQRNERSRRFGGS